MEYILSSAMNYILGMTHRRAISYHAITAQHYSNKAIMLTQTVCSPILRAGKTQFEEYIQHFLHFFTFYLAKKNVVLISSFWLTFAVYQTFQVYNF